LPAIKHLTDGEGKMEHKLQYFKEISTPKGNFQLNIYKKTPLNPVLIKIGNVLTDLRLEIESQTEDIDTPIVKTSLIFSLVDAPELNTANTASGNWEVFYTSDSTAWKVELVDVGLNKILWSGYITPDSYSETLEYHGVVTIIARDNIGHLQDFEFDAIGNSDGMITPYELLTTAWAKIESPMVLDFRGTADENIWPQAEGLDIIDTYINVAAYKGKTWYDAVNETLSSMGLVMRYVGGNVVAVSSLRRLPAQSEESINDLMYVTPVFVASGMRELTPAVKDIEEVAKYELQEGEEQHLITKDDFVGTTVSCAVNAKNVLGSVSTKNINVWPISNESELGWGNTRSNTLFFNPYGYTINLTPQNKADQLYLAVNSQPRMVWYGRNINCQRILLRLEAGTMIERFPAAVVHEIPSFAYILQSITGAIKLTLNGVEYYYNGSSWSTTYSELILPFTDGEVTQDINFGRFTGNGILQFFIFSIEVDWPTGYPSSSYGAFLGIKSLNLSAPDSLSLMDENIVRTIYDERNNLHLSRKPTIAPAYDSVSIPGLITNGIFARNANGYIPAPNWKWANDTESYQLAALIHKQLLCYHSKPNNVLSGTIVNGELSNLRVIWMWNEKKHLMIGGTLNYLTGNIENAVLREFVTYEEMW
jgi:hypothetical protein